ncbi:RNA demethylase ALKBH9B-like [Zingiber officinale]|uniref:RNA demethylase ALKBH9B-like n=1 Tax=Zingiber officinale TaxID=94328 RepID=UPI001C4C4A67|nr:RNA demethylase ALKBH9B-like [Zingiber officinale]
MVKRKKDFQKMEKVHGQLVNILEGLGLHARVFSPRQAETDRGLHLCLLEERAERTNVFGAEEMDARSSSDNNSIRLLLQLRSATISDLHDKHGNPPGIICDEQVDPIPPLLNIFGCFAQIKFKLQIFCLMIENKL